MKRLLLVAMLVGCGGELEGLGAFEACDPLHGVAGTCEVVCNRIVQEGAEIDPGCWAWSGEDAAATGMQCEYSYGIDGHWGCCLDPAPGGQTELHWYECE